MGIRFYCPNGHKLNVKSFLAGKRGICPHCGAKVDIPLDSTRDSGKEKPVEPEQADPNAPKAVPVTGPANAAPTAQPAPVAQPVNATAQGQVPMAQPVGGNQPLPAQPLPAQQPTPATAHPAAAPVAPATAAAAHPAAGMPAMPDPIAEAPQAVWYVRPASGGQFGPATGDIMQQWINEGRVAADSLVWREGWPDWRAASQTFPKFGGGGGVGTGWPTQASPY
ncbi:MAG: GYF domain-containing protein [Pirellulales bacterium]